MIKVKIEPRQGDRLYEIHIASGNNEPLLVSHQGYENATDAEAIVRRLFAPTVVAEQGKPEPVDLLIKYRDGYGKHEMLR